MAGGESLLFRTKTYPPCIYSACTVPTFFICNRILKMSCRSVVRDFATNNPGPRSLVFERKMTSRSDPRAADKNSTEMLPLRRRKEAFLYAGVCFYYGTCRSVNFRQGRKHNALSMEFCFLPVGRKRRKVR